VTPAGTGRRGDRSLSPTVVFGACAGFVVGSALIIGALRLPGGSAADVGPGRLPLLIGIALTVLSVAYALSARRDASGQAGTATRPALILLAALCLYAALMPVIGALASTALFMMAIMLWLDGWRHWLRSLVISGAFVGLVHLLFTRVISTPLP
jgi:putative tricarboxylic transport membrane protein